MQPGPQQSYGPPAQAPKKFPVWIIIILVVVGLGVVGVGTVAALGIFGVRRYLAAAKTSEAKNTLSAIARGARYAYETKAAELGTGKLCASAVTVPAKVPTGTKYMPASSGADFDTGDADTGWKCLKFSMTMPMYYQYSYHQGSGYLVRPGDAGPDGFEAAAIGDLDGDGDLSHFAMTGKPVGGGVQVNPSIYVDNETE